MRTLKIISNTFAHERVRSGMSTAGEMDTEWTRTIDIIHPDPGSTDLLGTKKIGDYAQVQGIAMNLHFAGSPVGFMASVHVAAATQNFNTLEHHSVGVDRWYDMYDGDPDMIFDEGYATVPEKPGLGVELNMDVVKDSLIEGAGFFERRPNGTRYGSGIASGANRNGY